MSLEYTFSNTDVNFSSNLFARIISDFSQKISKSFSTIQPLKLSEIVGS